MALTDSDGNTFDSQADYNIQLAQNNLTASDTVMSNRIISRESDWKGKTTGSNEGLGQFGPEEQKRYNITNPMDPDQNRRAIVQESQEGLKTLKSKGYQGPYGTGEVGIIHQQGQGGGPAILMADPNKTMGEVLGPFYKDKRLLGQAISQRAGWGDVNTPVGQWREHASAWYASGNPQEKPISHLQETLNRPHIDREHDVPLLAAGLMDKSGNVYGTAIDRRIPAYMDLEDSAGNKQTVDSSKFVHLHEMAEIEEMEKKGLPYGLRSSEAYTQAHTQVATPREQAAVQAWASEHGLEPTSTWNNYQKFWKNQMAVADREPEKVHPDTYLHPYDGHKYQGQMEKLSGRTIKNHPKWADAMAPEGTESITGAVLDKIGSSLPGIKESMGRAASGLSEAAKEAYGKITEAAHKAALPIIEEHQKPWTVGRAMDVLKQATETMRMGKLPDPNIPKGWGSAGDTTVTIPGTRAVKEGGNAPKLVRDKKQQPTRSHKKDKGDFREKPPPMSELEYLMTHELQK